jgi:hypothetical protein
MGADLLIGNNVLAQVPDLNDFLAGMKTLLNPRGVISLEYPHVMRTMFGNQFDQIYHEHFSYFSLATTQRALRSHGLKVFDVEELPTHGGSLRVYAAHADDPTHPVGPRVGDLLAQEESAGLGRLEPYYAFGERAKETKRSILSLLIELKRSGKSIVGYGAPGKGNTLLNYCGIRTDFLDYTVDRNPYKQGKFLPGSRIPIYHPDRIRESRPDYVFILPWNLKAEIQEQLAYVRQWGCRFIIPIPQATVEA